MKVQHSTQDSFTANSSVNMEPVRIKPPSTGATAASPTDSLYNDAKRIFLLIDDERHLSAFALYQNLLERLDPTPELSGSPKKRMSKIFKRGRKNADKGKDEEKEKARQLINSKQNELEGLQVGYDRMESIYTFGIQVGKL